MNCIVLIIKPSVAKYFDAWFVSLPFRIGEGKFFIVNPVLLRSVK